MAVWDKDTSLQFIEMYRSLPALWKLKSKEYMNKLSKERAYLKMVHFCQKYDKSADKQFVKNKINNLRSSFRKELKKVDKSKLLEAGNGEIYEPRLWYFHDLMFLKDQEIPTSGVADLEEEQSCSQIFKEELVVDTEEPFSPSAPSDSELGEEDFTTSVPISERSPSQESSPSPCETYPRILSTSQEISTRHGPKLPPTERRGKRKKQDQVILDVAHKRLFQASLLTNFDENEAFGKTLALLLKNVSKGQRIYARKLMYEVMAEAELGNLSRASYFVASPNLTNGLGDVDSRRSTSDSRNTSNLTHGLGDVDSRPSTSDSRNTSKLTNAEGDVDIRPSTSESRNTCANHLN